MSLRAPRNPQPAAPPQVDQGRALFAAQGCLDCHNGPRGSGTKQYTYVEIGTDDAMKYWGDPMLSGELCCGLGEPGGPPLTHGLKSPRLAGLWSLGCFLHNGSVDTLEELLCVNGPRTPVTERAYGNAGHEYGCNLAPAEKAALLAYLRSL